MAIVGKLGFRSRDSNNGTQNTRVAIHYITMFLALLHAFVCVCVCAGVCCSCIFPPRRRLVWNVILMRLPYHFQPLAF